MNISVLGGTFDPPHFGHLLVARQILEVKPNIAEVWLLPANTNPDKKVYASASDRLTMTTFLEEAHIKVSALDVDRGGETYTIDTVRLLLKNKQNRYSWVMGSDLLPTINKWEGYKEIITSMPFIIFPRPDYPVAAVPKSFEVLPENKLLVANYSGTAIRQRVAKSLSIEGLVSNHIANYIGKHKLYQAKSVYV